MAELDPTVRKFVDRSLNTTDEPTASLEEIWSEYQHRYPNGVPRTDFRWHLEEAGVDTVSSRGSVDICGTVALYAE